MRNSSVSFAIALPPEWQEIDLLAEGADQVLDPSLTQALEQAARGSEQARLLMLRSLITGTASGRPLSAGLCVTLAEPSAPVSSLPLTVESFEDRDVDAVTVPVGSGVRVRHVASAEVLAGRPPLPVLRVQYLIHTVHGLLTVTFTTAQAPQAAEWESLFSAMIVTCELA